MKDVLIVGAGGMGRWFARYFSDRSFSVSILDLSLEKASKVGRELGLNVVERPSGDEDIILVAVYLSKAKEVVESLKWYRGILIDISSVKWLVNQAMREGSFRPLSIHPLFGPGAMTLKGKTIVVTPIRDEKEEAGLARELFPEAEIKVMNEREHDRAVAYAIQLPHLLTEIASAVLSELDGLPIEGTSFSMLKMMMGLSLYSSKRLMKEMARINPYFKEVVEKVKGCLSSPQKMGEKVKWIDLREEYEKAYRCLEAMRNGQP